MNFYQVKPTQPLLAPKLYLFAALIWTAIVTYFCLIDAEQIPKITKGFDKLGHFSFHFGMVFLWFLFLNFQSKKSLLKKNLINAFLISLSFGILIEICQALFTTTRSADVIDVFANTVGGISAILIILILFKAKLFHN